MFNIRNKRKEEERYIITPKGIAWLMLHEADIKCSDEQFEEFWKNFTTSMKEHRYLHE